MMFCLTSFPCSRFAYFDKHLSVVRETVSYDKFLSGKKQLALALRFFGLFLLFVFVPILWVFLFLGSRWGFESLPSLLSGRVVQVTYMYV